MLENRMETARLEIETQLEKYASPLKVHVIGRILLEFATF